MIYRTTSVYYYSLVLCILSSYYYASSSNNIMDITRIRSYKIRVFQSIISYYAYLLQLVRIREYCQLVRILLAKQYHNMAYLLYQLVVCIRARNIIILFTHTSQSGSMHTLASTTPTTSRMHIIHTTLVASSSNKYAYCYCRSSMDIREEYNNIIYSFTSQYLSLIHI